MAARQPHADLLRRKSYENALRDSVAVMTPVVSNPATRVVDECVDPGTRHIVLRYHDGVVEVTRLRASSFRLPRLIGRTGAEVYPWAGLSLGALS